MSPSDDAYVPGRGNAGYEATGYDLDLSYRVSTNHLTGRARMAASATVRLPHLSLDLERRLRVTKVLVDGAPARWRHTGAKLHLTPGSPVEAGVDFVVEVHYAGSPAPASSIWGPVGWEELTDGVLAANQPTGAPSWFPCNDLPSQKAPFRIAVRAASSYRVVANGALVTREVRGRETAWVYEQREPMAPYLAVLQIGRYEQVDLAHAPVPVRAFVPPALKRAFHSSFARQVEMVEVFVEHFGPYPFEAGYAVVVTADPLEMPLEATGCATFGANHLDGTWERLIAHELAHQWFGNSVTAERWRDIWLHEGFACYAEWVWFEATAQGSADEHARHHHRRLADLDQDLVLADPGPEDMFDDRVYKRGALTLHAVRGVLGDADFWALLQSWLATHRNGVVSTADFVEMAEGAAGHSLEPLFTAWLRQPALPPLGS